MSHNSLPLCPFHCYHHFSIYRVLSFLQQPLSFFSFPFKHNICHSSFIHILRPHFVSKGCSVDWCKRSDALERSAASSITVYIHSAEDTASPGTSVHNFQTTESRNSEHSNLSSHCLTNLKSQTTYLPVNLPSIHE